MRDEQEIQRAHDILEAVLLAEVKIPLGEEDRLMITAATDVLCWILHHDHNSVFADNLANLERLIAKAGYVLKRRLN